MQTHFTAEQLADPTVADSEKIIRACVHCGFCLATCPTYALLGDERDSPRGRIYLIKDMLENDRPASAEIVTHVDRCLSCLACMTTCPSGVQYQHLIDHARVHVERTYARKPLDRWLRGLLAWLLPYPDRFRFALQAAGPLRRFRRMTSGRIGAMLAFAPTRLPAAGADESNVLFPAEGRRRARVALLPGCAQRVIEPAINAATIRVLNRHGVEVVVPRGSGCCGAIVHHLGKQEPSHALAKEQMRAWLAELDGAGLDAIVINASGCGTQVKDYVHMFRDDPEWAEPARRISAHARDISEYLSEIALVPPVEPTGLKVAYQSACSLQHGQRIAREPVSLLAKAGFKVSELTEGHLCCGSAGTYNLLQPEIATRLRDRKLVAIGRAAPEIVATGNIGCMIQLRSGTDIPVLHTVELLDWATGGPMPEALAGKGTTE